MQLQIMHAMGIYTASAMKKRYAMKDRLVADDFSEQKPFLENVMEQKATRNYPAMYWGSVRYFKKINEQLLINEQITLCQHIKNYQSVIRLKDESIDDLLQSIDARLTSPIFRNLYEKCSKKSFFDAFN